MMVAIAAGVRFYLWTHLEIVYENIKLYKSAGICYSITS